MPVWWQSHSGHIQLHLNTLGKCTFVPPSSCPVLSTDTEVMMQLLNTESVTVTQLYITDDAENIAPVWLLINKGYCKVSFNKQKLTTWKAAIQFSRIMMCLCSSEMSK